MSPLGLNIEGWRKHMATCQVFQNFLKFNDELLKSKTSNTESGVLEKLLLLKKQLREANERLKYYENIDAIIEKPYLKDIYNSLELCEKEDTYKPPNSDCWAITLTFDPSRFHNIQLVPVGKQIECMKFIILKVIEEGIINNIYGFFEYHKGRPVIHFHGIIEHPTNQDEYFNIKTAFTRLLSASPNNIHAVDLKRVKDLNGWLEYIRKADENNPSTVDFDEVFYTPQKPFLFIKNI